MTQLQSDPPGEYPEALATLKKLVQEAQLNTQRVVNVAMIELYWNIGRTILDKQAQEPWGSKVLERLAGDLKAAFPHMKGFSRTNLYMMRAFAAAWNGPEPIVQTPSGQLTWSHNVVLLNKVDDPLIRRWYAAGAVRSGWSVSALEHQIVTKLHTRVGTAPNNLEARLPHDGGTLAEFGTGFAFYGRQFHLDVEGEDFYIDLLLVHVPSNRFVVVELKAGRFRPDHLGQLNFYVAAVNNLVKFPGMAPTVGILVCGSKHEPTVRYALDGSAQPIAVSCYTYETLPDEERHLLPSPEAISAALEQGTVEDPLK
jgi:predicted nuclease of restriction endonuclease-like (RecB) superfamily